MIFGLIFALVLTTLSAVQSQTASTFEAASLKPSSIRSSRGGCRGIDSKLAANDPKNSVPVGRCVFTGVSGAFFVVNAYGVPNQWQKGAPAWFTGAERYDLEAKAENPSTAAEQQLLTMLQALLVERFKLKFHRETQDVPGFALVIDKASKLQAAQGDEEPYVLKVEVPLATLTATRTSTATLAKALSGFNLCLGTPLSPVVDKTGLQGVFSFTMKWAQCRADAGVSPGSDNTIPYALKELGLKLESAKVPQEVFVIDSVEKPAAN
jgi:uncharacterized protein (TIGR03435 family)